jgi:hypothetical protein
MGLFLSLSGVIGAESDEVKKAMSSFAQNQSGGFDLTAASTNEPNIGVITRSGSNTTVMYPDGFFEWDEVSKDISEKLGKTVFSFHIHDGDLWMFVLFQSGKEIGHFNPVPEYWEKLSPQEKEKWRGDASLIAGLVPTVSADSIARYFVEWDLEDESLEKAYPDDEFNINDCWQMCDFMKKVGFAYPIGDDGSIQGETFRFWTKGFCLQNVAESSPPSRPKRPWWKIW